MSFSQDLLFYLVVFVLGASVGSFINLLAFRILLVIDEPKRINQFKPIDSFGGCFKNFKNLGNRLNNSFWIKILLSHSRCLGCYQKIKLRENLPVLSYGLLKGKCSHCKQKISLIYPTVEFLFAIVALIGFFLVQSEKLDLVALISVYCLGSLLFLIAWIDLKTGKIPNDLNATILWLGLLTHAIFQFIPLTEAIFSLVICYISLHLVDFLFQLVRNKPGIGGGDIYLLSAIAAVVGIDINLVIVYSSFSAIVGFIFLVWLKKCNRTTKIPFAPFIAIGCAIHFIETLLSF